MEEGDGGWVAYGSRVDEATLESVDDDTISMRSGDAVKDGQKQGGKAGKSKHTRISGIGNERTRSRSSTP